MKITQHLTRTLGFTLVGIISFSIWAFGAGLFRSEWSLYTACAIAFFVLGGPSLLPFSGKGSRRINSRILWLFPIAFGIYAVCWCFGWSLFRNHFGEIMGSAVGILALCAVFRAGLPFKKPLIEATAMVFLFYTLGYYLGEKTDQLVAGTPGKLGWGAFMGLGLGGGLSYLIGVSTTVKTDPN